MQKMILSLVIGVTTFASFALAQVTEDSFDVNSIDLPNFQTVIQGQVYRGGAPTAQGIQNLARSGIKTIVDLRNEDPQGSAAESNLATSLGMKDFRIPLSPYVVPSDQVIGSIETGLLSDSSLRPIFVHCHHGEDRTGLVIGLFRVFKQNPAYAPNQAYAEMLHYGFHPELYSLANYFFEKTKWHP